MPDLCGTRLIDTSAKNKISESAEILKGIFFVYAVNYLRMKFDQKKI